MSKNTSFVLTALFTLSILSSCRKVYDYIHDHPDGHESLCRVMKMSVRTSYSANLYTFSYNAKGDPISILDSGRIGTFGNDDQYFRYDRFGRLSDYVGTFIGQTNDVIFWHKYAYARPNFITDTTLFYIGDVTKPSPNAADAVNGYSIHAYTLDAYGRIAGIYDANGNLVQSNPDRYYDDKVNVYRTSKVWQFVYQNYSRNNLLPRSPGNPYPRLPDPVYNDFGLPLQLPNSFERTMGLFGENNIDPTIDITYACALSNGPINY